MSASSVGSGDEFLSDVLASWLGDKVCYKIASVSECVCMCVSECVCVCMCVFSRDCVALEYTLHMTVMSH